MLRSCCLITIICLISCRTENAQTSDDARLTASDGAFSFRLEKNDADEKIRALYFDIYYALQNYGRNDAQKTGVLYEFTESLDQTGALALSDHENQIKCDTEACELTLQSAKPIGQTDESTIGRFFQGIALGGSNSSGMRQILGQEGRGPGIVCTRADTSYACEFNLFRKEQSAEALAEDLAEKAGRQPGVGNCSQDDATVKQAQAAQAELVDGGLLPLYAAPEDRTTVGYVRYSREEVGILFVDMFLCGDVSHSYFYVGANGEAPANWVADPRAPGNAVRDIPLAQDEAELHNTATIVKVDPDSALLEIDFTIKPSGFDETDYDPTTAAETAGAGKFYMSLPMAWIAL